MSLAKAFALGFLVGASLIIVSAGVIAVLQLAAISTIGRLV